MLHAVPGSTAAPAPLTDDAVHVWVLVDADVDDARWARFDATLDADERARADAFVRADDRRRFVGAHGLLRHALSACAPGVPPAAWRFVTSPLGRPSLAAPPADLRFSLSHTPGAVACAVSQARDVGVDVQHLDPGLDPLALAAGALAPAELAALRALASPAARLDHFYALWTLKEAYLKARGVGAHEPLDGCAFSLGDEDTLAQPAASDRARWRFLRDAPSPRHCLAVAAALRQPAEPLTVRRFGPLGL